MIKNYNRDRYLDQMRGVGVLMMIIFHFIYDLNYFNFININLFTDIIYIIWRYIIVAIFMNAVGISLVIAYKNKTFSYFLARLYKLTIIVAVLSLVSYLAFPNKWIYFGILHVILVSSIIGFFFKKNPNIALVIAIAIIIANIFNLPDLSFITHTLNNFLPKQGTLDFYPLFPWLAMVFSGIFLAYHPWYKKIFITKSKLLEFLGKNALIIYLSHQLILFSFIAIIAIILKKIP